MNCLLERIKFRFQRQEHEKVVEVIEEYLVGLNSLEDGIEKNHDKDWISLLTFYAGSLLKSHDEIKESSCKKIVKYFNKLHEIPCSLFILV